ncbi:MAG: hypothetical protein ABJA10_02700 [Aestuariivirga sp.]
MTAALIAFGLLVCVALGVELATRKARRAEIDDDIELAPEVEMSPHCRTILTLREQQFEI